MKRASLKKNMHEGLKAYVAKNKIRFVTATALFDGHDASINIMRRLLQNRGVEVIHLGHNRSALDVAKAAIEEDVQAVAVSSYQGGHMEYFTYLRSLLDERGGEHIKIFAGGGGVITLSEIEHLKNEGIALAYSPEDGQKWGLMGIIGHIIEQSDFKLDQIIKDEFARLKLAREITRLESSEPFTLDQNKKRKTPVLGVTGTGGAGKSSILDEILLRFLEDFPNLKIATICIDPTKKKTQGALLGDRIRMNSSSDNSIFLRSMATRGSGQEVSSVTKQVIDLFKNEDFDWIIVETSGIGQANSSILELCDFSLYVMTPEYGASTQLEKIDMLDFADFICVNKFERRQGPDALKDVEITLRRSRFAGQTPKEYPVFGTIANRFNDPGTNGLYKAIVEKLASLTSIDSNKINDKRVYQRFSTQRESLISPNRQNYLADISATVRAYHRKAREAATEAAKMQALEIASTLLQSEASKNEITDLKEKIAAGLDPELKHFLQNWHEIKASYRTKHYSFKVRGQELLIENGFDSLSQKDLPKIGLPASTSYSDLTHYFYLENRPGYFPFSAGLFPFRRDSEDPKRQFAGEGGPQKTNKRFHYLCKNDPAKRLSTAFDSVTLYGSDPAKQADIYGKVGESGVSVAHLDDMKLLYHGFDLCAKNTSVSMTINGPAAIILAMFFNCAIDQRLDQFRNTHKKEPTPDEASAIKGEVLNTLRGTVQADILKEDQAQNTCIFSTEFSLRLMGDIQAYMLEHKMQNYYGVSISGYHIAEAGANPITQLALTLANGFTYVEYYLARGMAVDDFSPNLSFFFSNGIDCEYAVLGRVARRIWAIAMRDRYQVSERAQKLKYHIQTSGRSLHAQEMDFNDIRTTLQALLALYDNCNSLHTNAYDEALTTPTEESVRRAMAIQLIINREFGPNKCENVNQGSYFLEELSDLVEEAVLQEFDRISERGGVLGAMETQYQRNKIQEESMYYEELKHSGALPIIGINTFLDATKLDAPRVESPLIRSSYEEKDDQLKRLADFQLKNDGDRAHALSALKDAVLSGRNIFSELMNTVRHCSLGEITEVLYKLGGRYRRSM